MIIARLHTSDGIFTSVNHDRIALGIHHILRVAMNFSAVHHENRSAVILTKR